MPQPFGRSRSHPAPQELISFPSCFPGWWTSKMGTRPCGGVGVSLEPGTSDSLLIRFKFFRQCTEKCFREKQLSSFECSFRTGAAKTHKKGQRWSWKKSVFDVPVLTVPAQISCCLWRCHEQTPPTKSSDSMVLGLLSTSAPSSSHHPLKTQMCVSVDPALRVSQIQQMNRTFYSFNMRVKKK